MQRVLKYKGIQVKYQMRSKKKKGVFLVTSAKKIGWEGGYCSLFFIIFFFENITKLNEYIQCVKSVQDHHYNPLSLAIASRVNTRR